VVEYWSNGKSKDVSLHGLEDLFSTPMLQHSKESDMREVFSVETLTK